MRSVWYGRRMNMDIRLQAAQEEDNDDADRRDVESTVYLRLFLGVEVDCR